MSTAFLLTTLHFSSHTQRKADGGKRHLKKLLSTQSQNISKMFLFIFFSFTFFCHNMKHILLRHVLLRLPSYLRFCTPLAAAKARATYFRVISFACVCVCVSTQLKNYFITIIEKLLVIWFIRFCLISFSPFFFWRKNNTTGAGG